MIITKQEFQNTLIYQQYSCQNYLWYKRKCLALINVS